MTPPSLPARLNATLAAHDPPVLTELTEDETRIAAYQIGFAQRMRKSADYVVETAKSTELPRYTDKYRPSAANQPTLKKRTSSRRDPHPYPLPLRISPHSPPAMEPKPIQIKKRMNIDEMADDDDEAGCVPSPSIPVRPAHAAQATPSDASDTGSQAPESDYDVDEEYDNDYADNYFDNGENDDNDDLGGAGPDEGGSGSSFLLPQAGS
ncbi:DNA-directed RNA polymerase III, subunit Rpc31 [Mycena latifolia]|nr:DNA-directed RNA polymerase III, subunit Rpc31 [Mycena latifolia]